MVVLIPVLRCALLVAGLLVAFTLLTGCPPSATPSSPTQATPSPAPTAAPNHSADWGLVYATADRLCWVDARGGAPVQLAVLTSPETLCAEVSPEGKLLAILSQGKLTVVDLTAPIAPPDKQIPLPEETHPNSLAWSHDGARLAYTVSGNLYLARPDASTRQVTSNGIATEPAWSPDDRTIAYGTRGPKDEDKGLWLLDTTSGAAKMLVPPSGDPEGDVFAASHPVWSPDGRWIAFLHAYEGGALCFVSPDGSSKRIDVTSAWWPLYWLQDSSCVVYDATNAEGGPVVGLAKCTPEGQPETVVPGLVLAYDLRTDGELLVVRGLEGKTEQEGVQKLEVFTVPLTRKASSQPTASLAGYSGHCRWKPDGTARAVLAIEQEDKGKLYVAASGEALRPVANGVMQLLGWSIGPATTTPPQ
ncbi:MAG: hypothetical protein ABFE16_15910 [Armatimonadia bacterium]